MATFLTEKSAYIHLPKTGGTWVMQAVRAVGIPTFAPDPLGDQHYSGHGHAGLRDIDVGDRLSIAFVRHPLDWWRSYWGDRMSRGWMAEHGIDAAAASGDFNDFVSRALDFRVGYVDDLVEEFVGLPPECVDFVGRYECLTEDLCTALSVAHECFSDQALREVPRQNFSDYDRHPALYRRDVAERLAAAEHRTIERFYAHEPIPAKWLMSIADAGLDGYRGNRSESGSAV